MSEVMKSLKSAGGPAMSAPQTYNGRKAGGSTLGKAPIPAGDKLQAPPQGASATMKPAMKS